MRDSPKKKGLSVLNKGLVKAFENCKCMLSTIY
jgi:hypothetical protein